LRKKELKTINPGYVVQTKRKRKTGEKKHRLRRGGVPARMSGQECEGVRRVKVGEVLREYHCTKEGSKWGGGDFKG